MNINSYKTFCSNVYVSRETYRKFCVFSETLLKWQSSINLISKDTIKNIWERHILDSAQLYKFVKNVEGNIFDFGSGAGFPGIILSMMGQKNVHLVESDSKKCVFLREVAMHTDIDVTIHNSRIESLDYLSVDIITARALAPLNKLIDYVEIYMKKSPNEIKKMPKMLFLKGKSYGTELLELKKTKKLDFETFPSLTDRYGQILYIKNVDMIKLNND